MGRAALSVYRRGELLSQKLYLITRQFKGTLVLQPHPPLFSLVTFTFRVGLLALLFILTPCTSGRAQIVNIEDKRRALDSPGGFVRAT